MRLPAIVLAALLAGAPRAHAQAVPKPAPPGGESIPEASVVIAPPSEEAIVVETLGPEVPRLLPAAVPTATLHTLDRPSLGVRRFARWAVSDVRAVGAELTPERIGLAAAFVYLLPFVSSQDGRIGREAPRLRSDLSSPPLDVADELGAARMQWVSGLFFASTLLTDDDHLQDAAFTSFEAGVYAMLISSVTKGLVGRSRPIDDEGPFVFRPFSEHRSFPSGHTTLAFALVTPWVVYYPRPLTFGLYALSTGTAVARLSEEAHWVTDVIAGAALGTLTGYWLARRHLRQSTPIEITPSFGPAGGGVTLRYTF